MKIRHPVDRVKVIAGRGRKNDRSRGRNECLDFILFIFIDWQTPGICPGKPGTENERGRLFLFIFVSHVQVRKRVKVRFIFQKVQKRILRDKIEIIFRLLLFFHHVFHPRDLHLFKNSPNRRKYCFSLSRNSLFRCLRSQAESWFIQYVVILKVSDMSTEFFSGRISGLCGWKENGESG